MKKKLVLVVIAAVTSASLLTGCNGSNNTPTESVAEPADISDTAPAIDISNSTDIPETEPVPESTYDTTPAYDAGGAHIQDELLCNEIRNQLVSGWVLYHNDPVVKEFTDTYIDQPINLITLEIGDNPFLQNAAEWLHVTSFSELSARIQSKEATGIIYITPREGGAYGWTVDVEIDGTDIKYTEIKE